MCTPRYGDIGAGCVDSGWGAGTLCISRCVASVTLVTPTIAVTDRERLVTQTYPFELGTRTWLDDVPASARVRFLGRGSAFPAFTPGAWTFASTSPSWSSVGLRSCRLRISPCRASRSSRTIPARGSAVESGDAVGLEGVRYVKLEDGALVTRSLFERDGQLVEGQPTCPPTVDCLPFPVDVVAQAVLGAHPEPRTGHAVVLSATREALYVLGGRSRDDARELHDAWRFDLRDARWEQLVFPAGPSFGRILAATYSAARDTLFVLDALTPTTASGPRQQVARLIAVHPRGGAAEVVASWPRLSGNDAYALAPGASGEIWVAGSPVPGRMHTVARLVLDEEGWRVDGWLRSGGALRAGAAHASREGLTLVLDHQSRGAEIVAVRVDELRDQPHGERACF